MLAVSLRGDDGSTLHTCSSRAEAGSGGSARAYADCFTGRWADLLSHRPGIFGPNQIIFRNEDVIFSASTDPDKFYRSVMFPLKASIDVEYFSGRTCVAAAGT